MTQFNSALLNADVLYETNSVGQMQVAALTADVLYQTNSVSQMQVAALTVDVLYSLAEPYYIAHTTGGNATSVVMTKPTGTAQDDLMLQFISSAENGLTITPPSGWALLSSSVQPQDQMSLYIYKKVAGASEPASYTWGFSRDWNSNVLVTFRNATTETIGSYNPLASGNATGLSITPGAAGLLVMFCANNAGNTTGWTPPTGMVEVADYQSIAASGRGAIELSIQNQSATSTGNKTATPADTARYNNAVLLQLVQPASLQPPFYQTSSEFYAETITGRLEPGFYPGLTPFYNPAFSGVLQPALYETESEFYDSRIALALNQTQFFGGAEIFFFNATVNVPTPRHKTIITQYNRDVSILADIIDRFYEGVKHYYDFDKFYEYFWNIRTAKGYWLDVWGVIVGADRYLSVPVVQQYFGFDEATDALPFDEGIFYDGATQTNSFYLSDDVYRRVIMAKAMSNIGQCSIPYINEVLSTFFAGRGTCYVTEDSPMNISYVFDFTLEPWELALLLQKRIFLKPAGVHLSIVQP